MRRQLLDERMRKAWFERVNDPAEATRLVMDALKCGPSKADKLANGRYPSRLSATEIDALTELMAPPDGVVTAKRKRA